MHHAHRSPSSLPLSFAPDALSVFALIWAVSGLVHQVSFTFWLETWQGWIVTFTTFLVILEPRCLVRFSAMLIASLINLGYKLPFVPNHILFEGMVNLTILLGIGHTLWRARRELPSMQGVAKVFWIRFWPFLIAVWIKAIFLALTPEPADPVLGGATSALLLVGLGWALVRPPVRVQQEAIYAAFAPVLRVEVVVMYFWAAIQKCNADYLDSVVSCASELHLEIAAILPFVPAGAFSQQLAIFGSVALEAGIPVLLMVPRLRIAGFVIAMLFHFWLSIHPAPGIYSFSALLFALYYVFLPASRQDCLHREVEGVGRVVDRALRGAGGLRVAGWGVLAIFLSIVIVQAVLYVKMGRNLEAFAIANRIGFGFWVAWGLMLGAAYVAAFWLGRGQGREWPNRASWNLGWVVVGMVVWNGLNPWIGLKTQTAFSMYSNLRSEGFGNHLFLKRIDLFPLQKDLVEVIESEPSILEPSKRPTKIQQFANQGSILPYFELRRLLSEHEGEVRVRYRRGGEELVVWRRGDASGETLLEGDAGLFGPIPWYLYKTLWFRRHTSFTGRMHCTH